MKGNRFENRESIMATTTIGIVNQKGGVGKTTTAINLAACLAERKKRVLLVDLDPQANATSGLGLAKQQGASLYPALVGKQMASSFVQSTAFPNLDIIPSELDLSGAEVEMARTDAYLHCVKEALAPIVAEGRYDYILLDCSPTLGMLTMNVLTASNSVILPIQCEYFALEGLAVMSRVIRQLRERGANPAIEIEGIVMTLYDGRTNLAQQVVQEVVTHYGAKVFETLIPRNIRLAEAPSFGKPVIFYDTNCTGSVAYRQLTREFLQRRHPEQADDRPALGAALRRIFDTPQPETPLNMIPHS
jgi:chromosome partitioning protein